MATVPSPKTWAAGLWSAADMNIHMRDTLEFFLNPPICIVRRDQRALAMEEFTYIYVVEWDTVVHDNDGMFSSSKSERFTCRTPGYYLISFQIQWHMASASLVDDRQIFIHLYDSNDVKLENGISFGVAPEKVNESYSGSIVMPMSLGDYILVRAFKFANQADSIVGYDTSNGYYGNQLSARWISAL